MARENATRRAPRTHDELLKLGFQLSETTVSRDVPLRRNRPSQGWRTVLENHATELVSTDFFVVPTITFRILYVFVVLAHKRRKVVHIKPRTSRRRGWTAQQMVEAFPYDSARRYILRGRDRIYGADFVRRVYSIGIEGVLIAPRSPRRKSIEDASVARKGCAHGARRGGKSGQDHRPSDARTSS